MSASLVSSHIIAAAASAGQTTKASRSAPAPSAQKAQFSFSRNMCVPVAARQVSLSAVRSERVNVATVVAAFAPPTVGETKAKLLELYPRPIPNMYNVVLQELLVQQHFVRYNVNYQYDPIYALGICSIYDQILGGEETMIDNETVFDAYIASLGESAATYRSDSKSLEEEVAGMSLADLKADAAGNVVQKALADVKARQAEGKFHYSRFFAVGLFRMLELAGATDPKALDTLVAEVGVSKATVAGDLATYKGILSKLNSAKELMKDFLARERKVNEERLAKKAEAEA